MKKGAGKKNEYKKEPKFCSFDCDYARAEVATSASKSCMTFNGVYCRKLKRRVSKGALCEAA